MRIQRISEVEVRRCVWLWPWRLGLGKLAIFDGDPGLGKSLVALDLCARVTTGRAMPDGQAAVEPSNVLVFNAEDGEADTLRPRLNALGADLRRVFVVGADDGHVDLPRLPRDVEALDRMLEEAQAKLLVIDPIMAFLDSSVTANSDQSIRRALAALAALAKKHQCAVILVRHLNKVGRRRAIYRGSGSMGLLAACRSAWLLAADPADGAQPNRRILAQIKNNLAGPQPSLALELAATDPPFINWLGTSLLTSDELLGMPRPSAMDGENERRRAAEFLLGFLKDAPRPPREVWHAAQVHGLSKRTLQRAQKELEIRCTWVKREGDGIPHAYWCLPGQEVVDTSPYSLEPWLAPLRARFPAATPLEVEE